MAGSKVAAFLHVCQHEKSNLEAKIAPCSMNTVLQLLHGRTISSTAAVYSSWRENKHHARRNVTYGS
jgi:hypothetical protein